LQKSRRIIITSTLSFLLAQTIVMLALANKGQFFYLRGVLTTTILWLVYTALEIKRCWYMNDYVRVLVMLAIFGDGFGGYYCELYARSFIFDKILHIFCIYSLALFGYILAIQLQPGSLSRSLCFILTVGLGLGIGVLFEIIEFIIDKLFQPVPPSQPSLLDTNLDLVSDLAGALLAGFHAASGKLSVHRQPFK